MKKNLLIVGSFEPPIASQLEADFVIHQTSRQGFADLDQSLCDTIQAVATFGWAPKGMIDRLPALEIISSFGVGYDGVAAQHAASKGIMVAHTPDVLNDEVAATAIGLLLATTRRIVAFDKYVREGRWSREGAAPLTRGLAGKLVGIVGLGRIGEAIAEKLAAFNCRIAYHSRNKKPGVDYSYYGELKDMARDSDVLIVITPGGPATEKLVSAEIIDALGPDGTLINVARGTVVDETAMISALQEGRLGAAGLDVFEEEPHVPEAFFKLDNVVLAPHIGSATVETRQAMADRVVENLKAFCRDGRPINPVPECSNLTG